MQGFPAHFGAGPGTALASAPRLSNPAAAQLRMGRVLARNLAAVVASILLLAGGLNPLLSGDARLRKRGMRFLRQPLDAHDTALVSGMSRDASGPESRSWSSTTR